MNNLHKAFENSKAFVPFITCGDPDVETTEKLIYAMQSAGADMIELGIPFSDPTAEGVVVQESNIRALANKITTDDIFEMLKKVSGRITIPMVFVTYANVVFSYGPEKFMKKCAECSIAGIVLQDIPFEEKKEFQDICSKYDVELISMIAETSGDRINMIASEASGFINCLLSDKVMDKLEKNRVDVEEIFGKIRKSSNVPLIVSADDVTPEHVKLLVEYIDGITSGSAIVKICAKYGRDSEEHVSEYVKTMKNACRG
ncbi:MAG: tryptophan synthase subunit alpha [Lachnospiraceae bacterium]|nr:tryptophan synthase subunit alpha [Lachnospiraceae bacterium]